MNNNNEMVYLLENDIASLLRFRRKEIHLWLWIIFFNTIYLDSISMQR